MSADELGRLAAPPASPELHELPAPRDADLDQLHAECAPVVGFTGLVREGGRIFATFAAPPAAALEAVRAKARAHIPRGRP